MNSEEKKYYFLKLVPRRSDFAQTMTEEERAIMFQHIEYWKEFMNEGVVEVFGPVMDPHGTYGIGVVGVRDESHIHSLIENDPAAKINEYEFYPMRAVVPDKK